MLDMRTMSTPCKHFQATLGGAFALLCVSDRNDRVGLSPDDQHRTIQPSQWVMQVDELLSIPEAGIGGRGQCPLRARPPPPLSHLPSTSLLNHAAVSHHN